MAYLVQLIDTPIYYVDDSLLSAYHSVDPYHGLQTAPPAPPLLKGVAAQPTKHVR